MPKGTWTKPRRNWKGIPFEQLRRKVDVKFNAAHDALTDAYYNYWRHGLSKPWRGFDVQATPEDSKALFEKLHGLIFHLREVALYEENMRQPTPDKRLKVRHDFIEEGRTKPMIQIVRERIAALRAEGIELSL